MNKIKLKIERKGTKSILNESNWDCYYPRMQINKHGDIVFAFHKASNGLTKGILVAKTPDATSKVRIGSKFTDWEIMGELVDYDGEVKVSLKNISEWSELD